jgi:hypothetical protein
VQHSSCQKYFRLDVTCSNRWVNYTCLRVDQEGLWKKKYSGLGITEDQVKIEEHSMILTSKVPNVEVEKIGDIGETADLLDILYDPVDILL